MTHDELLREKIAQDIERIMGNAQRKVLSKSTKPGNAEALIAWNKAVDCCLSIVRNTK